MAEHGKVLGGVPSPDPAPILVKGDIEHTVDVILDAPVTARDLPEGRGGERGTEQVIAVLHRALAPDPLLSAHHTSGFQAWPVMLLLEPTNNDRITDDPGLAGFDPSVPGLDGLRRIVGLPLKRLCMRRRKAEPDVCMQHPLVLLEGEDVGSLLIENLPGNGTLTAHGIDGHHTAGHGEGAQEVRRGGNLVGLLIHPDLSQNQAIELAQALTI